MTRENVNIIVIGHSGSKKQQLIDKLTGSQQLRSSPPPSEPAIIYSLANENICVWDTPFLDRDFYQELGKDQLKTEFHGEEELDDYDNEEKPTPGENDNRESAYEDKDIVIFTLERIYSGDKDKEHLKQINRELAVAQKKSPKAKFFLLVTDNKNTSELWQTMPGQNCKVHFNAEEDHDIPGFSGTWNFKKEPIAAIQRNNKPFTRSRVIADETVFSQLKNIFTAEASEVRSEFRRTEEVESYHFKFRCLQSALAAISLIALAIGIIAICAPEVIPLGLAAGIVLISTGGLGTLCSAIGLFRGQNPGTSKGNGSDYIALQGTP